MVEQGKGITQELALLNTLTGGDYSRQVESYTNLFSCITRCPWGSCAERTQTYLCQTKHGNEPPVSGHIPKIIWTIKVPPCEATFNKTEQKRSVLLPALSGVWDNRSLPPSLILRHQNWILTLQIYWLSTKLANFLYCFFYFSDKLLSIMLSDWFRRGAVGFWAMLTAVVRIYL